MCIDCASNPSHSLGSLLAPDPQLMSSLFYHHFSLLSLSRTSTFPGFFLLTHSSTLSSSRSFVPLSHRVQSFSFSQQSLFNQATASSWIESIHSLISLRYPLFQPHPPKQLSPPAIPKSLNPTKNPFTTLIPASNTCHLIKEPESGQDVQQTFSRARCGPGSCRRC